MDERRYNRRDPWEPGMYETGRTRPRKSHGGLVALLLVVVILLCGIISALSVLNVKLFAELEALSVPKEDSLSFINESEDQHPSVRRTTDCGGAGGCRCGLGFGCPAD